MNVLHTLILAVLQGVTEFLPISSSGHLVLLQNVLGLNDIPIFYDLLLHLGTTIAIIIVYYETIGEIIRDLFIWLFLKRKNGKKTFYSKGNIKLFFYIILATAVTGILGILFKKNLESFFYKPRYIPLFLFITGAVLLFTRFIARGEKEIENVNICYPAVIGFTQAFAILPGISRSGTTIAAGLFMGARRKFSAAFSFLLSIPSIFGASLYEFISAFRTSTYTLDLGNVLVAFIVSMITGYVALKTLINFLSKGKLYIFSIYCFTISILGLFLIK
jgi:undecaprenyl-diphosphatase